jgi:hypothetical protein
MQPREQQDPYDLVRCSVLSPHKQSEPCSNKPRPRNEEGEHIKPKAKKGTKATIGRPHPRKASTKIVVGYRRIETMTFGLERG